jgi:uncharacterized membrane-anchored protein
MKSVATDNLRKLSFINCFVGFVASVALFLIARQQAPILVVVLFIGWFSAPSVVFLLGHYVTNGWAERARRSLYLVNLLATSIALAIYLYQTIWPRQTTPAFYWVAVPPAVIIIALIVVGLSALTGKETQTLR